MTTLDRIEAALFAAALTIMALALIIGRGLAWAWAIVSERVEP